MHHGMFGYDSLSITLRITKNVQLKCIKPVAEKSEVVKLGNRCCVCISVAESMMHSNECSTTEYAVFSGLELFMSYSPPRCITV